MSNRVRLPGADELFRRTSTADPSQARRETAKQSSGRVKHDEKVTVYVSADELIDLEQARLTLRRELGVAVDRGRLIREAVAIVLADLDERGVDSDLVRRLHSR